MNPKRIKKRRKERIALRRGTRFFQLQFLPEAVRKLDFVVSNEARLAPNILGSFPVELKAAPNYSNLNLEGNDSHENLSYEEFPELMHNFLMTTRHHPYQPRQENVMESRFGVSSPFTNSTVRHKKMPGLPPAEVFGRSIWNNEGRLVTGMNFGVDSVPHISFSDAAWFEPFRLDEEAHRNLPPGLYLLWLSYKASGPNVYDKFEDYLKAVTLDARDQKLLVAEHYLRCFTHLIAENGSSGDHPPLGVIIKRLRKEELQKVCSFDSDFSPSGAELGAIPIKILEQVTLRLEDEKKIYI
eukprot:Gregarina_sp_Poly_1__5044@NODE_2673_length_1843_cov_24_792793_g1645_i1_p1_GENE_NODE_2673_length_1843_cov_24_792793_g1645_i1NODE_2673_length_1843_cov_24_792793_g1645_i1_p1_ORF_typecomplete_len327_score37_83_NODE_2673_length_1843_cov_24_792793_g1645_i189982